MPYPNEHAARIREPEDFQSDSFRRKNIKRGIDIIVGRPKGETTTDTQAYRFKASIYTAAQAKAWLKDNKIKYIRFEPATGENMKWFNMKAAGPKAEIEIFSEIGGFGINAKQFRDELKRLGNVKELEIAINSPGGSVIEGMAIYNTLLECKATKIVRIMGWAASMASVIAMAGDEIYMGENTFLMIHNPWTASIGDADRLRKDADLLEKIKGNIISAYQRHAKLSEEELSELMDEETWLDSDEAVELGFANAKFENMEAAAKVDASALKMDNIPTKAREWIMANEDKEKEVKLDEEKDEKEKEDGTGQTEDGNSQDDNEDESTGADEQKEENTDSDEKKPEDEKSANDTESENENDEEEEKIEKESEPEDSVDKLIDVLDNVTELKAKLEEREEKIKRLNDALNEKQSKCDKLQNDVNKLADRLGRLTLGGTEYEPDGVESWSNALERCGGDYVKARKTYPQLYKSFMERTKK